MLRTHGSLGAPGAPFTQLHRHCKLGLTACRVRAAPRDLAKRRATALDSFSRAGRGEGERFVIAPVLTGDTVPPVAADPAVAADPEHVEAIGVAADPGERAGLGRAGRSDDERLVVAPVLTRDTVPPVALKSAVAADPEHVEAVGVAADRGERAGLGRVRRSDGERFVVAPVLTGDIVPPVALNSAVAADPEHVEAVRVAADRGERAELGKAGRSDDGRMMV